MKRKQIFRKIFSALFAAAVLFTVSVREVHYLFAHHDAHEHCENHLHSADEHKHCTACKFDVAVFTDVIGTETSVSITFIISGAPSKYTCPVTESRFSPANLRGPPALA